MEAAGMINAYEILGAHAGMSDDQIKAQYRALARQHHPDKGGDAAVFAQLPEAYAEIKDLFARARYVRTMNLVGTKCLHCSGSGFKQKTVSFTRIERTGCPVCKGAGWVVVTMPVR